MLRGKVDLFGNEHPAPASNGKAITLDLFDAAAESRAMESGRPVSQERSTILAPVQPVWSPPVCPVHGTVMLLEHSEKRTFSCPRCYRA
jgi:hypothetical protein